MGVEFPSRTSEQRARVLNLITFLQNNSSAQPELSVSPKALVADLTQFEPGDKATSEASEDMEDPLLELLRRGTSLQQEEFLTELQHQRNPQDVAAT
jgi:hypothetical protein